MNSPIRMTLCAFIGSSSLVHCNERRPWLLIAGWSYVATGLFLAQSLIDGSDD